MIKLIIFDLDGVLVETKELHYHALNDAILDVTGDAGMVISLDEHIQKYDGLPTNKKLQLLSRDKVDAQWNSVNAGKLLEDY